MLISSEDVLMNAPNLIFWKNKQSIYLGCNYNFANLLGLTKPEDIIGKSDHELNWQKCIDGPERFIKDDIKTIRGNPIVNAKEHVSIADKGNLILIVNKKPLYDKMHNVIGVIGISVDITPKKKIMVDGVALSNREIDCIFYMMRGYSAKQIAIILKLSPRTIEYYINNLKNKFGCRSKPELLCKIFANNKLDTFFDYQLL